ncbi:MAG: LysR family transcriptional regulator [Bacteriovoracaceae bacterium]|jgi:DNA-binding transcriptional LysR family regulator|nr:LysR family transcriptional regulator [Bacteriovoracaceae bacterium]
MIDSNQLNVLMAVEASSTLSEAAGALGITQSAVSQNLKSIEAKVGFNVVTKVGKKVTLTPSGIKLAKIGKNYFKRLDQAISEIHNANNKIIGEVKLGTMFGLGKSWIIHRMVEFSENLPDLSVQVKMDSTDGLLKKFDRSELDCLVLPSELTPAHAAHKVLHEEQMVLVYSNKLNIDKEITLKEFSELDHIFFDVKDTLFYNWCRAHFGQIPRNLKPRLTVNSFGNILAAVSKGMGVAAVPYHVFKRSPFFNNLEVLGPIYSIAQSKVNFVYHAEDIESLKVTTLYDFLKKEVDRLEANES